MTAETAAIEADRSVSRRELLSRSSPLISRGSPLLSRGRVTGAGMGSPMQMRRWLDFGILLVGVLSAASPASAQISQPFSEQMTSGGGVMRLIIGAVLGILFCPLMVLIAWIIFTICQRCFGLDLGIPGRRRRNQAATTGLWGGPSEEPNGEEGDASDEKPSSYELLSPRTVDCIREGKVGAVQIQQPHGGIAWGLVDRAHVVDVEAPIDVFDCAMVERPKASKGRSKIFGH